MKARNALLSLLAIFAMCGIVAAQNTPVPEATAPKPTLALGISPYKTAVSQKNAVLVMVTFTKVSDHQLDLAWPISGAGLDVDVRDESGKLAPDTDFGKLFNRPSIDDQQKEALTRAHPDYLSDRNLRAVLGPKESNTWPLDVDRFYDMHQPGKYTVQVQTHDSGNHMLMIKSNTVTVTVTP